MALVDRLGFVVDATEAPSSSTPNFVTGQRASPL
jgi:hypothetical protein